MLHVGIHHRDKACRRRQNAFDAGAGQSAPGYSTYATYARIAGRDFLRKRRCPVGRIIVDKDHLPRHAGKGRFDPIDQHRNIVAFLESRNDN